MTAPHTPSFPHLFAPLAIGGQTARNRIVNSGHGTSLGPGTHNEDLLSYEERRARGGAAIVITQANAISPGIGDFYVGHEAAHGKYHALATRIQAHGALSFVQINHPGKQAWLGPNGRDEILHSASAVPQRNYGHEVRVPRALEDGEIRAIIADFGRAAGIIAATPVNGVELHFGHGNLVQQFLSPELNLRSDEWGGSAQKRSRFARRVLEAVREQAGSRLIVGARVNLELQPQEEAFAELTDQIVGLIETGLLDYVSVSGGNFSSAWGTAINLPDASFPPALWREGARRLKQAQGRIPVFLAGRVLNAVLAEELVATGVCDAVTMARELVADPDLPRKAAAGQAERVRPCVGIQSGCWQRVAVGKPIHCAFNPVAGREADHRDNPAGPGATRRRVVVVGAGPAGLEAARYAAELGHEVTLFDRRPAPGGLLTLVRQVPHRQDVERILGWFGRELAAGGVRLRLGEVADADTVLAEQPDAVIVATGGLAREDEALKAAFAGPVLTVGGVFGAALPPRGDILVFDAWGGRAALSAAEYLAVQGHGVRFVTALTYAGEGLDETVRRPSVTRLARLGVTFLPEHALVAGAGGGLALRSELSGETTPLATLPDAVVSALVPQVNTALYDALRQRRPDLDVQIAGDARAPRGITEATREGFLAARRLGRAAATAAA